ncbi:MAG: hypothetical protein WBJ42_03115 [Thermovirgaceae bacterium]|nr:hypothetical protein [Synergistales bacterium]HPC76173.1 hypothetical protein [Synergistales bacterium]HQH79697.1 hypothetical protein [Synergistaceae bacterium]
MKKRVVLFLVLTVLMAGMLLAWGRFGPVPHGRVVVPEDPGVKTPEVEVTAEPTPESAASPARSGGVAPGPAFRPAQGEPFSREDLEAARTPRGDVITGRQGEAVFDPASIHPAVGDMARQAKEIVEELDKRTLETTEKVLEALPFVNIRPEKAELRPSGDGVKLTITVDPEDISFGTKRRDEAAPAAEASSGDEEEGQKPGR